MKKYLYSALALPLLFACSSENFDEKVITNDQFAGIEKVDATFSMEGTTRFDGGVWKAEEGDLWGFAWMGDGTVIANNPADGKAYQNHNLIQTDGIFTPQTSIYVGKYYIYRPYDKTVVSPAAINFSLEKQPLAEGFASSTQGWKDLAKKAINIGDKWTEVTTDGTYDAVAKKTWDKAGINEHYKIYAAMFSNQTGLDLTYVKNNPKFAAAKRVQGATDIDYTYAAGTPVGAADIYKVKVGLAGAAKSFTYAPTKEPNAGDHDGDFWANKKDLAGSGYTGFTFNNDVITLEDTEGVSTGDNGSKGWFWFNSLPVTAGNATAATAVQTVLTTSYGVVTVDETVGGCAYEMYYTNPATKEWEWRLLADATDLTKTPKEWALTNSTFINQYGNHRGKFAFDVDFSTGVMNGMDIKNDAHLQKLLKYYIASSKNNEPAVVLNLLPASATDNTFKISKISIALLQTINATKNVKVSAAGLDKVIVTQDGQTELGLADKTEVPNLDKVFDATVPAAVSLAAKNADGTDITWTWKERSGANQLTVDAGVASLTNEGDLTVNATNIELSPAKLLTNAALAKMNITQVTTVKSALRNLGTINVGSAEPQNYNAELRAYGVAITNDATALNASGTINNWGVVGVTYNTGIGAQVNNYGTIDMKQSGAITLLTSNEVGGAFQNAWAGGNKLGTVKLPGGAPNALVSVSNGAETGFIEYVWDGGTTYATPNSGTVKYNTIIVSTDIKFTTAETEIKYIKFNGVRTQVINPTNPADDTDQGYLTSLKGIIVEQNKSIIIEKNNGIVTTNSAHLKSGAAIYQGGIFNPQNANIVGKTVTDYLGTWSTDQVVVY